MVLSTLALERTQRRKGLGHWWTVRAAVNACTFWLPGIWTFCLLGVGGRWIPGQVQARSRCPLLRSSKVWDFLAAWCIRDSGLYCHGPGSALVKALRSCAFEVQQKKKKHWRFLSVHREVYFVVRMGEININHVSGSEF